MGLACIRPSVANPVRPGRILRLKFLVDSGDHYSLVPASVLKPPGIFDPYVCCWPRSGSMQNNDRALWPYLLSVSCLSLGHGAPQAGLFAGEPP